ncbi:GNAT family N-acetyltransferase [Curtobacterium poinsettiae]|uniref:GNAT family N-acetyltransferase n=1 Tax=Curtobacterium poinsettiae TaxID=159612 RepID=UPI001BDDED4E|nr:GNAT family N-acetyltransferase [Curtobacterium flaccumfaciens]MBT1611879.1 GNAT family N-acetyltransferase [Curtobacterium flaccumfaciens pv. poinsettiae]
MSGKQAKRLRRQQQAVTYWHGGVPGRQVGDFILSANDRANDPTVAPEHRSRTTGVAGVTRPDHVYFSTDRDFARAYAGNYSEADEETGAKLLHGTLYRVEPEGPVEVDPDFPHQVSYSATRARVVDVVEEDVFMTPYDALAVIGRHKTWVNGSPMYSPEGEYLPHPEMRAFSSEYIGPYPPWVPHEWVVADLAGTPPKDDRPDPKMSPGILLAARTTAKTYKQHQFRQSALHLVGVQITPGDAGDEQDMYRLLDGTTNRSITDDAAKHVVVARHPTRGVIGVLLVDIESIDGQQAIWVAAIAVDENFRHMGVGSTLLNCVHRIVPAPRVMTGGLCPPDVAPFFAQAGFTVLRPGVTLPVAIGNQYRHHKGIEDECWFYRQTDI